MKTAKDEVVVKQGNIECPVLPKGSGNPEKLQARGSQGEENRRLGG